MSDESESLFEKHGFVMGYDGAPMRKAWPDGYPIVRPGDRVRITHLRDVRESPGRGSRTKRGQSGIGQRR